MTASRLSALKRTSGDRAQDEHRLKGKWFSLLVLALVAVNLEGCRLGKSACRTCSTSRGIYAPIGPALNEPPLITNGIPPVGSEPIFQEGPAPEGIILSPDAQPPMIQAPYVQNPMGGSITNQPPIFSAPAPNSNSSSIGTGSGSASGSDNKPARPSLSDPPAVVDPVKPNGGSSGSGAGTPPNASKPGPAELDALPLPDPPPNDPQASLTIEPSPLPMPLLTQRLTRLAASSDEPSVLPLTAPSRKSASSSKPASPANSSVSASNRSALEADRKPSSTGDDAELVKMIPVPRRSLPDEPSIALTAAQTSSSDPKASAKTQPASAAKAIISPVADSAAAAGLNAAPGVMRFAALAPDLAAGSLPDAKQLRWLADKGYKTLVDLGDPNASRHTLIADAAKLGMRYIALPLNPVPANSEALKRFQNELKSSEARPIYFFDNDGSRAGAFWCMHRRLSEQTPQAMAEREAAEIGLRDQEILEATRRFIAQTQSPSQAGDGFTIPRDHSKDSSDDDQQKADPAASIQIQAPLAIPPASSNPGSEASPSPTSSASADDPASWGWKSLGAMTVTMMAIPAAYYGRQVFQKMRRATLLTAANPREAAPRSAAAPSSSDDSRPV